MKKIIVLIALLLFSCNIQDKIQYISIPIICYNSEDSGFTNQEIRTYVDRAERIFEENNIYIIFNIYEIYKVKFPEVNISTKVYPYFDSCPELNFVFKMNIINIFWAKAITDCLAMSNESKNYIFMSGSNEEGIDYPSLLAHEIGHQFGLADTTFSYNDPQNLMWNWEVYRLGTGLRKEQKITILKHLQQEFVNPTIR